MFESIKKTLKKIQNDPPGKRFRRQYKRRKASRQSTFQKIMLPGLGVLIVIGGIVMLPAPGPGMLVIFLGLGLIAQESLYLSMLLDKAEVKLRDLFAWCKKSWNKASVLVKSLIILLTLIICVAAGYAAYLFLL